MKKTLFTTLSLFFFVAAVISTAAIININYLADSFFNISRETSCSQGFCLLAFVSSIYCKMFFCVLLMFIIAKKIIIKDAKKIFILNFFLFIFMLSIGLAVQLEFTDSIESGINLSE